MNNLLTFVDPMQLNKEMMPVFGGFLMVIEQSEKPSTLQGPPDGNMTVLIKLYVYLTKCPVCMEKNKKIIFHAMQNYIILLLPFLVFLKFAYRISGETIGL